jgi:hypothetical protein
MEGEVCAAFWKRCGFADFRCWLQYPLLGQDENDLLIGHNSNRLYVVVLV